MPGTKAERLQQRSLSRVPAGGNRAKLLLRAGRGADLCARDQADSSKLSFLRIAPGVIAYSDLKRRTKCEASA